MTCGPSWAAMARTLRLQFPGALYHVINRGNYRRDLFETTGAGEAFLAVLEEAVVRFGWRLHAYVLMRNHYHLALETPQPNLVDGMHWLQSTVATRFNRFRRESGHLFQGRYKSILIEDAAALARVVDYIHLNPARARVVEMEYFFAYRWSSLFRFIRGSRFPGLVAEMWLQARGGWHDDAEGWTAYRNHLHELVRDEARQREAGLVGFSRGWAIGTDGWKKAIAAEHRNLRLSPGIEHEQARAMREAAWDLLVDEALAREGKARADLVTRPRVLPWKLAIARGLRDCGASISWIADRLLLGKPSSLRSVLCRTRMIINQQTAP
jgi:putative transposase